MDPSSPSVLPKNHGTESRVAHHFPSQSIIITNTKFLFAAAMATLANASPLDQVIINFPAPVVASPPTPVKDYGGAFAPVATAPNPPQSIAAVIRTHKKVEGNSNMCAGPSTNWGILDSGCYFLLHDGVELLWADSKCKEGKSPLPTLPCRLSF